MRREVVRQLVEEPYLETLCNHPSIRTDEAYFSLRDGCVPIFVCAHPHPAYTSCGAQLEGWEHIKGKSFIGVDKKGNAYYAKRLGEKN